MSLVAGSRSSLLLLVCTTAAAALTLRSTLGSTPPPCRAGHLLASASLACDTARGKALATRLSSTADASEAQSAWERELRELAERWPESSGETEAGDLAARVAELRRLTSDRAVLVDCLRLSVARALASASLELVPFLADVAPGAELPPTATSLETAQRAMPSEAARQLKVFLAESSPSADPSLNGKFDRLQGAQLYMGHLQFGYFLAQVFRGTAHLEEQRTLSAAFARRIETDIEASTRRMRSEAAWSVASGRAGDLFELIDPNADAPGLGCAALWPFTRYCHPSVWCMAYKGRVGG